MSYSGVACDVCVPLSLPLSLSTAIVHSTNSRSHCRTYRTYRPLLITARLITMIDQIDQLIEFQSDGDALQGEDTETTY